MQRRSFSPTFSRKVSTHIAKAIELEEGTGSAFSRGVMWLGLLTVAAFFGWAYITRLEVVAVSAGEILPAGSVQVVQHIDGGRLSAIHVSDGDLVAEGQALVEFNNVRVLSEYQAFQARYWALFIRTERLRALAFNREPDFSTVPPGYEDLIAEEMLLLGVAREQFVEFSAQIETLSGIYAIQTDLVGDQLVPRVQVLDAERALGDAQLELLNFTRRTLDELNEASAELSETAEQLTEIEDRLNRTVLVSPVDGIIQELQFRTIGGVVPPGETLMNIVPVDDRLEAELRVSPTDIGFVRTGQPVNVKVGTYDFMRYGTVPGTVSLVSPSSSVDEQGQTFFRVIVSIETDRMPSDPSRLIQPGMTVQADIVLDNQTVLQYLMRPMVVAFREGLGER